MSSLHDIPLFYIEDKKSIEENLRIYLDKSLREMFKTDESQENIELFSKYKDKINIMVSDINKFFKKPNIYQFDENFMYDFSSKNILDSGRVVKLNNQEITLLEYLIKNRGDVISYDTLVYIISNKSHSSIETLRTVIKRLRAKMDKSMIETISKIGYRLL